MRLKATRTWDRRQSFDGTEIIISPLAKGNATTNNISVYARLLRSEDTPGNLPVGGPGFLGGRADATDLSDLFKPGASLARPEPSTWVMMGLGFAGLAEPPRIAANWVRRR